MCDLADLSRGLKHHTTTWTPSLSGRIPRESILELSMRFDLVLQVPIPSDVPQDRGRCCSIHQANNLGSLGTGRALCIQLCSVCRQKACDCRPQSQYHVCVNRVTLS